MEAHYLLGITYQGLGMLVQSISELERAVQLNETDFDSQYKLGSVLREDGKYEEAISHLKRAVILNQTPKRRTSSYAAHTTRRISKIG